MIKFGIHLPSPPNYSNIPLPTKCLNLLESICVETIILPHWFMIHRLCLLFGWVAINIYTMLHCLNDLWSLVYKHFTFLVSSDVFVVVFTGTPPRGETRDVRCLLHAWKVESWCCHFDWTFLFSGLFAYLVLLLFVPCPFSANGLFSWIVSRKFFIFVVVLFVCLFVKRWKLYLTLTLSPPERF